MFTRTDKPATPATSAKPEAAAKTNSTAPETGRGQAVAQPLSTKATPGPSSVSVISKALKITGQLESSEDIQIDGIVDGDVRAVSVIVGTGARVKGTVYGESVELSGTIEGKIEAKKVVLTGTAHMAGDIIHKDIAIASGAFIDGHCRPEFNKGEARSAAPASTPLSAATNKATS